MQVKFFFRYTVLVFMLSSQVWTNAVCFIYHYVDADFEIIELVESEEKESEEKESDTKKEKDIDNERQMDVRVSINEHKLIKGFLHCNPEDNAFVKIEIPPPRLV